MRLDRFGFFCKLVFAAALALALFSQLALAAEATQRKSVLILSGVQYGLPVADAVIGGAVTTLKNKGISGDDIYVEYLDLVRNADPRWRSTLATLLRDKLAKTEVSLVIAQNQAALDFLAQEGQDFAPPDTPVLATLIAAQTVGWRGPQRPVLNIVNRWDIDGTLRLGLDVFPRTRHLFVVAGADALQSRFVEQVSAALAARPDKPEIETAAALSYEAMLQRAASLPPDSLVLLGTYFNDRTGRSFIPADVAADIAQHANAPVLGLYDTHIQQGLTGGSVVPAATVGRRAGEIGFELLSGARRLDARNADATVQPQPLFDWSQLQRWGADPAKLPADTVFLHRPRTLWGDYRETVIGASVAIVLLSILAVALARQRAKVEDLYNHAPCGYHSLDAQGRVIQINQTELDWLGYTRQQVVGRPITDYLSDAGVANFATHFPKLMAGSEVHGLEIDLVRHDGSLLPVLLNATAVRKPDGTFVMSRSTVLDISERRAHEHALQQAHAALERERDQLDERVRERTLELAVARDAAESANRARTALFANISHELRTPLNHIVGQVYLLEREPASDQRPAQLDVINKALSRLIAMIDDLINIARLESEQLQLVSEAFLLNQVLDHASASVLQSLTSKGLSLQRQLDPALPAVLVGDAKRLGRILEHLLENAAKFSDQGQITLRVQQTGARHGLVDLRFEVEDQGPGISEDARSRLFDLFEQGDGSATRQHGGVGLGLALCQRLVALMGGRIGVEPVNPHGSRFWFTLTLPAQAGDASPKPSIDSGPVDKDAVRALAQRLVTLLADSDADAQTFWQTHRQQLSALLGDDASPFSAAIDGFEFETALAILEKQRQPQVLP